MSLVRFLSAGRLDGETLGHRLRSSASAGDDHLWTLVSDSAVGRLGGASVLLVRRAATTSVVLNQVRSASSAGHALTAAGRMRLSGTTVTTAVVVHLLLAWPKSEIDPWRLLLPGLAGTFGLMVLALSFLSPSRIGSAG